MGAYEILSSNSHPTHHGQLQPWPFLILPVLSLNPDVIKRHSYTHGVHSSFRVALTKSVHYDNSKSSPKPLISAPHSASSRPVINGPSVINNYSIAMNTRLANGPASGG